MVHQHYVVAKRYENKALLLSFFLHVIVLGFYFLMMRGHTFEIVAPKTVVLEIASIERVLPKPMPPLPEVKNVEPIKPVEEVKPKSISKPKPIVKHEVSVPKPVQEVVEPTPVMEHSVVTPPQEVVPSAPVTTQEPFVKTDFEIIRDKVLARLVYPSAAKRMRLNGVVHVALLIGTDGYLISATVQQSSGKELLDNAALAAANKLKGIVLPKPQVTSTVILPIAFKIK